MEDFKKELDEIKKLAKEQFSQIEGKTEEELKDMKSTLEKANELAGKVNEKNAELEEAQKKMQEQIDAVETKAQEYKARIDKGQKANPRDYFKKELENSAEFEDFKRNGGHKSLRLDEKELNAILHKAIMTTASNLLSDAVEPDRISTNTWAAPHEMTRIRSLIRFGTTSSNTVSFVRQTANTASADTVTEGSEKPESSETLSGVEATVQTIAHVFRITKHAMDDYGQMATYLSTEGIAGLKDIEDTQLLSGSGVSPDISGIITQATGTFSGGASTDSKLDSLLKAVYVLKNSKYMASQILVDTTSMRDIKLLKDDNGQYIFPNFLPLGLANPVSVDGVPVIEHTAMPAGTFLVGDFSRATGWDREAANVRFSEENEDNFVKNLISVRVEERLALAVYRPDAFLSETFANALTLT